MASPTIVSNLTPIWTAESITGAVGNKPVLDADIKKQGDYGVGFTSTTNKWAGYGFSTTDLSGQHLRMWMTNILFPYLDSYANRGIEFYIKDSSNNYSYWTVGGNDTYFGGWLNICVYSDSTPDNNSGSNADTSDIVEMGVHFVTISTPRNVQNVWVDYFRYGDGIEAYGGASGDEIAIEGIFQEDDANGYGIVEKYEGIYYISGELQIGDDNSTNATYYLDQNEVMVFRDHVTNPGMYKIQGIGNSTGTTNIEFQDMVIRAETNRFIIDMDDANVNSFSMTGGSLTYGGAMYFKSGQSVSSSVFANCLQIITGNCTFENNTVKNSVDSGGALLWPADDSNISDVTFVNCDKSIEYDSSSDGTPVFVYLTFDDVSGKYDVNNTSGGSISISNSNSNANSYTGSLVTFLNNPVTTQVTVKDANAGIVVEGARVFVYVANGVNFPYNASVSITGTGTTATVAHTSHGLSTGDKIWIKGADQDVYNGAYVITVTGTDTYTYTTSETITTSPATGTITATMVLINDVTSATGILSDTRPLANDQPISGWARKGSVTPLYAQSPISETVDKDDGILITSQLSRDD